MLAGTLHIHNRILTPKSIKAQGNDALTPPSLITKHPKTLQSSSSTVASTSISTSPSTSSSLISTKTVLFSNAEKPSPNAFKPLTLLSEDEELKDRAETILACHGFSLGDIQQTNFTSNKYTSQQLQTRHQEQSQQLCTRGYVSRKQTHGEITAVYRQFKLFSPNTARSQRQSSIQYKQDQPLDNNSNVSQAARGGERIEPEIKLLIAIISGGSNESLTRARFRPMVNVRANEEREANRKACYETYGSNSLLFFTNEAIPLHAKRAVLDRQYELGGRDGLPYKVLWTMRSFYLIYPFTHLRYSFTLKLYIMFGFMKVHSQTKIVYYSLF